MKVEKPQKLSAICPETITLTHRRCGWCRLLLTGSWKHSKASHFLTDLLQRERHIFFSAPSRKSVSQSVILILDRKSCFLFILIFSNSQIASSEIKQNMIKTIWRAPYGKIFMNSERIHAEGEPFSKKDNLQIFSRSRENLKSFFPAGFFCFPSGKVFFIFFPTVT